MKTLKGATLILLFIAFASPAALCQSPTETKENPRGKQIEKLSPSMMEFLKSSKSGSQSNVEQTRGSLSATWDTFLTLVEQELNRASPSAPAPWEGKEVTWEGTVRDMEVMMDKNLVRLVLDMPERTLTIKGNPVTANKVMIFVPMNYENMGPAQEGAKVRFKTTIAPIDANHPAVSAQTSKDGGKGFLLIFTKGGTILK